MLTIFHEAFSLRSSFSYIMIRVIVTGSNSNTQSLLLSITDGDREWNIPLSFGIGNGCN